MKLTIVNNQITLVAESNTDALVLLNVAQGRSTQAPVASRPFKKHRKHQFMKQCTECGGTFRGGTGLATHKRKKHFVPSYTI